MIQDIHKPLIIKISETLDEYVAGRMDSEEIDWYELDRYVYMLLQDRNHIRELHEALQPFYLEYLCGRNHASYEKMGCYGFMNRCIDRYEELGRWFATESNLMDMIDGLAASQVGEGAVFSRLQMLMATGYRPHMKELDIESVNDEIARQKVQKELYRGEHLCILHAFLMIEGADKTDKEKDDLEELLRRNWGFVMRIYSIMAGSVIGDKQNTFTSVCNNVKIMRGSHPYLHLFMAAIMARETAIMPDVKARRKMDKHFRYLEDIIAQTPQKDTLDELCKILFGKEFEKAVATKQYASYRELEGLVEHWKEMATNLGEQLKELEPLKAMCQSMMEAMKHSIPVDKICDVIVGFDDPKVSEMVFTKLDWELEENEAWASKRKEMKRLIKAKLMGPEKYKEEMMRLAKETSDALKNQKPSIIGQMNLGNGTQQLPPDFNKALENLGGQR